MKINKNNINKKTIFLTGGTGSFGQMFVAKTLKKFNPKKIIIYSRDEMKQWKMKSIYENEKRVEFFIGDVRDKDRLKMLMNNVDIVIHAAATKIVPTAEENPFECIKTNIIGAMNVLTAASEKNVKKIVALSTDKASSPVNLYGATKLCSDKLFVSGNFLNMNNTKACVVRYGNVMGSRGSVIPFFLSLKKNEKTPITHKDMTRFMISLDEALKLVWFSICYMKGGEIYVKKIPSMKVTDIAKAINSSAKFKFIGIRAGEKIHEQMIGLDDALNTFEYGEYYKILPHSLLKKIQKSGKKVKKNFVYSSEKNEKFMTISQLKKWLNKNKKTFIN